MMMMILHQMMMMILHQMRHGRLEATVVAYLQVPMEVVA
jgi:hypothetical protein